MEGGEGNGEEGKGDLDFLISSLWAYLIAVPRIMLAEIGGIAMLGGQ